jgi:hypothetical protein
MITDLLCDLLLKLSQRRSDGPTPALSTLRWRDPLSMLRWVLLPKRPLANRLIMELINIIAHDLGLVRNPQVQTRDILQNHEQTAAHGEAVARNGADLSELLADLDAVAVDGTRVHALTVEGGDARGGEDAGPEAAEHAADAVELEDFEPVVDAEPFVDVREAADAAGGEEADGGRGPEGDETGGWGDAWGSVSEELEV